MAATTTELGLVTPTQGTLSGTWGDTVNYGITEYVNIAIAGTLSFAGDGAITLANTTGNASASNIGSTTAQYMVIRITGTQTVTKVITGPSYSKLYMVDHAGATSAVTFKASGQTGVSIAVGEKCFVYYNGTDYVKVASSVADGVTTISFGSTGLTPATATSGAVTVAGTLAVANGGTGLTSYTANGVLYASGTGTLASGSALTFDGTNILQINGSSAGYLKGPSGEMLIGQDASAVYVGTGAGIATAIPIYYGSPGTTFQRWQTGGSERMRLDSSGNLGVGTTAPNSILQVSKASANPTIIATRTGNSATTIGDALYLRLNDSYGTSGMRTEIGMGYGVPGTQTYTPAVIGYVQVNGTGSTNGDIYFGTRSVTTDTAPTERVRIDSAGTFTIKNDYQEQTYTANSSTAITLNITTNGTDQVITLTGTATITMPTATAGKSFLLKLKTGAGGYTVTWSTVKWPGGTAPTLTSTASRMDIFSFFSDGTNWYGCTVGQNYTP